MNDSDKDPLALVEKTLRALPGHYGLSIDYRTEAEPPGVGEDPKGPWTVHLYALSNNRSNVSFGNLVQSKELRVAILEVCESVRVQSRADFERLRALHEELERPG